jgi:hypothetical protein
MCIFSAVRSNKQHDMGFVKDHRRLNVALTRARHMLAVVCNAYTVSKVPTWQALLHAACSRGRLSVLDCTRKAAGNQDTGSLKLLAELQQRQHKHMKASSEWLPYVQHILKTHLWQVCYLGMHVGLIVSAGAWVYCGVLHAVCEPTCIQ